MGSHGKLGKVHWIDLPSHSDERGILTAIESGKDIPFDIKRIFYMHHIVTDRGGHAHIDTDQVVIASSGSFRVDLSNGEDRITFLLNDPRRALYIPKLVFTVLYDFSNNAVCLVLASTHYEIKRSIRNWEEYLAYIRNE